MEHTRHRSESGSEWVRCEAKRRGKELRSSQFAFLLLICFTRRLLVHRFYLTCDTISFLPKDRVSLSRSQTQREKQQCLIPLHWPLGDHSFTRSGEEPFFWSEAFQLSFPSHSLLILTLCEQVFSSPTLPLPLFNEIDSHEFLFTRRTLSSSSSCVRVKTRTYTQMICWSSFRWLLTAASSSSCAHLFPDPAVTSLTSDPRHYDGRPGQTEDQNHLQRICIRYLFSVWVTLYPIDASPPSHRETVDETIDRICYAFDLIRSLMHLFLSSCLPFRIICLLLHYP